MSPAREVVEAWFAAWGTGDLDRARTLMGDTGVLVDSQGREHLGFDAFADWYAARRAEEGEGFSWQLERLLDDTDVAVALIRMSRRAAGSSETWLQVATYRVADGRLARVELLEGPRRREPVA